MDVGVLIIIVCMAGSAFAVLKNYTKRKQKWQPRNSQYTHIQERLARANALKIVLDESNRLFQSGQHEEAISVLDQWGAGEADPLDGVALPSGYYLLGLYYARGNCLDKAAPFLQRALTYSQNAPTPTLENTSAATAHELLAHYYSMQGNIDEKQKHYRSAAEYCDAAGQHGRAARNYGLLYDDQGKHQLAAEQYAEALADPPYGAVPDYRPRLLVLRMIALFQAGHHSETLVTSQEVIAEKAADVVGVVAYRMLALVWARVGYFAEAENFVSQAKELETTAEDKTINLTVECLLLLYQGRYNQIKELCQAHIASSQIPSAQIYSHLGNAFAGLGEWKNAEVAFQRAIAQAPITEKMTVSLFLALFQLGLVSVLIEEEEFDKALSLLETAHGVREKNAKLFFYVPAVSLYARSRSKRTSPETVQAQVNELLVEIAREQDKFPTQPDALRFFTDVFLDLARALFFAGDAVGSLQILDQFGNGESLLPGMKLVVYYWRGRCLEAQGNMSAAIQAYFLSAKNECDTQAIYTRLSLERLQVLGSGMNLEVLTAEPLPTKERASSLNFEKFPLYSRFQCVPSSNG